MRAAEMHLHCHAPDGVGCNTHTVRSPEDLWDKGARRTFARPNHEGQGQWGGGGGRSKIMAATARKKHVKTVTLPPRRTSGAAPALRVVTE